MVIHKEYDVETLDDVCFVSIPLPAKVKETYPNVRVRVAPVDPVAPVAPAGPVNSDAGPVAPVGPV